MQQIVNDSFNQAVQPELFAGLSLMERSVWMLYSNEGFSEVEISEITGLTAEEVQQMLIGIRHKLCPMTVQLQPFRKRYWLSVAAMLIGLVCSTFLYLQQTKTGTDTNSVVTADKAIVPEGTSLQQNIIQPEILVAPPTAKKTPVKHTITSKIPVVPTVEPSIGQLVEQMPEKQGVIPGLATTVNIPEFKPKNISPLNVLQTGIQIPVSMQPTQPPMHVLSEVVLLDHNQLVNQPATTLQKLRLALTPHSFANTDERVSIAMLLPGVFLSGE
jgi:hypothetical protein